MPNDELESQAWPNVWKSATNDINETRLRCQLSADEISETDSLKKNKCKTLPLIGVILMISGLLAYLIDPNELIQEWAMKIAPNSMFLATWQSPPVDIYTKAYIFNYTNPDAFLSGIDEKLKVREIGPFVFREFLKNTNVQFHDNGTMTYTPRRTVEFIREMSVADTKEMRVIVPNIAFLGLGSMLADSSMITNLGALSAIKYLGPKPFLNITVEEYLWGYEDPLVEIAHAVVSNWISFTKLGILDRMYDEGENAITIRLEDNGLETTDPGYLPKYSIDSWNGSPGLTNWGFSPSDLYNREEPLRPDDSEKCRFIKGATEGTLFPRNLDPTVKNYVFRKPFCRHMPIEFKKKASFMPGITAHWYGMPDNVFDTVENNPENLCYCDPEYQDCVPKGLTDITPCYYNIPAAVSFPHFLNADPKLVEAIDGISPDEEKHGSNAIIQPQLGSVIGATSRMQTNLIMKNINYNADLIPLSNLYLPIFWVELSMGELSAHVVFQIYSLLVITPILQISSIILGIISALLLLIHFVNYLCKRKRERRVVIQTIGNPFTPAKNS